MTDTDTRHREVVADLGQGLQLWRVHLDQLREQDVNARSMGPAAMRRLQATIARDGRLESLPLAADTGGAQLELVSGHHRVRAARAAGMTLIYVLVDVSGLTRDRIAAKQLAHNSINGTDEAQLIARIFDSITDVDARLEAFIDPRAVEAAIPDKVSLPKLDLDLQYRSVLLVFLPRQADRFTQAIDQLSATVDLDRDHLYVVDQELYAAWRAAVSRMRKEYDARAASAAVSKLLDAVAAHLGLEAPDPDTLDPAEWVPLADVLGTALVPPDAAKIIRDAVDRFAAQEELGAKGRWRVLELLCADWLANPDV